jgi:hypothetical protein
MRVAVCFFRKKIFFLRKNRGIFLFMRLLNRECRKASGIKEKGFNLINSLIFVMRCSDIKKYKQLQIKLEKGIMNYFQANFIENGCILQNWIL